MRKIFLYTVLILCMITQPVWAKAIAVQALDDFSTENPSSTMRIKVLEDVVINEETTLASGCVVEGKIVDVVSPKRLKRNASFTFVPLNYTDLNGKTYDVKGYYPAKYTTKLNKGELAKTAALGVGSFFVKGLSLGYSAIEGAVKNEKDNRFKSSVNSVYEDSPFSYVEKGGEIVIQKEQNFFLNFKVKDDVENEENLPNYNYVELDSKSEN